MGNISTHDDILEQHTRYLSHSECGFLLKKPMGELQAMKKTLDKIAITTNAESCQKIICGRYLDLIMKFKANFDNKDNG